MSGVYRPKSDIHFSPGSNPNLFWSITVSDLAINIGHKEIGKYLSQGHNVICWHAWNRDGWQR